MSDPFGEKLPKSEIAQMSESDLLDISTELGKAMGRLNNQMAKMRGNLVRVKNELRLRREGGRANGQPLVSDHAVVRYLERHKGMDISLIREEIRSIAASAKYVRDEKRSGERLTDEETGITLVYSGDRNSIATILSGDAQALIDA